MEVSVIGEVVCLVFDMKPQENKPYVFRNEGTDEWSLVSEWVEPSETGWNIINRMYPTVERRLAMVLVRNKDE